MGLRKLSAGATKAKPVKAEKAPRPSFKQYRESDGRFHFKLLDERAGLLLQSRGFDTPQQAAQTISALLAGGATALAELADRFTLANGMTEAEVVQALQALTKPIL